MSGYIELGYTVVLATLATYSVSVIVREKAARRRLSASAGLGAEPATVSQVAGDAPSDADSVADDDRGVLT
ncbi:MAG: hypothetical protein ACLPQS_11990 [Acidimicrobiales bacterium]